MSAFRKTLAFLMVLMLLVGIVPTAMAESLTSAASVTAVSRGVLATGVSLNKTKASVEEGLSVTLKATVRPSNASSRLVTWKSSRTSVATVSSKGVVTGVKKGTAKITATSKSNPRKIASCTVTVKAGTARVTSVALNKKTASLTVGDKLTLKATVKPANAKSKAVTWKSSKSTVASVTSTGKVTAKKAGTATITATSKSNKLKKATCKVTVKKKTTTTTIKPKGTYYGVTLTQQNYSPILYGPHTDGYIMRGMMGMANYGDEIYYAKDCSAYGIRNVLTQLATLGQTENDTTLFYYSGHGLASDYNPSVRGALCGVDGGYVTVDEVRQYLDKVPGTVIVVLDSCLSGQYITSRGRANEQLTKVTPADFNKSVVQTFVKANAKIALTGSAKKAKYKIITAAAPLQSSWSVRFSDGYMYGLLTYYFAEGGGYYPLTDTKIALKADTNGDKIVTLQEMYVYAKRNVDAEVNRRDIEEGQDTQVWPANDGYPILFRK